MGGYKASGLGRTGGTEAADRYQQTKSIWCGLGEEGQDPFVLKPCGVVGKVAGRGFIPR
jgi:hypothetical protein